MMATIVIKTAHMEVLWMMLLTVLSRRLIMLEMPHKGLVIS